MSSESMHATYSGIFCVSQAIADSLIELIGQHAPCESLYCSSHPLNLLKLELREGMLIPANADSS